MKKMIFLLALSNFASFLHPMQLPQQQAPGLLSEEFCTHILDCAPATPHCGGPLRSHLKFLLKPEIMARIPPSSLLLYGPSDSGKSTLARAFAQKIGTPFIIINGQAGANSLRNNLQNFAQFKANHAVKNSTVIVNDIDILCQDSISDYFICDVWDETRAYNREMFFIGTTCALAGMSERLRSRMFLSVVKIPASPSLSVRKKILLYSLKDKACATLPSLDKVCQQSNHLSKKELCDIIAVSSRLASVRNSASPVITDTDLQLAFKHINEPYRIRQEKQENEDSQLYQLLLLP